MNKLSRGRKRIIHIFWKVVLYLRTIFYLPLLCNSFEFKIYLCLLYKCLSRLSMSLVVLHSMCTDIYYICNQWLYSQYVFNYTSHSHLDLLFLTWDVMTSMDAMKRSAMIDTPRNMYISEAK